MESELKILLRKFNLKSVCFGPAEFNIYGENCLDQAQLGYSRHPNGRDLTGNSEGDWKEEWIVFGYDGMLGDPYFVDVSDANLPVYEAMHGAGAWPPEQISPGLENFLRSLEHLSKRSHESVSRMIPSEDTVTDRNELRKIELELTAINMGGEFWKNFIERHIEWLEDSGY